MHEFNAFINARYKATAFLTLLLFQDTESLRRKFATLLATLLRNYLQAVTASFGGHGLQSCVLTKY